MKKKKKTPLRSGVDMSKMTLNQKRSCVNSLKEWTPIEVNWNDAFSKRGWLEIEDLEKKSFEVHNIGLYLKSDNRYLYLANGCTSDRASITDLWGIPLGMITSIKLLS